MSRIIRIALGMFTPSQRLRLAGVMVMVVIAAGFETFSVGLVLPFVSMVSDPAVITSNPWIAKLHQALGEPSSKDFIVGAGIGLGVLFVVRNFYLAVVLFVRQRFVYSLYRAVASRLTRCFLHRPYSDHLNRNSADFSRMVMIDTLNVASGVVDPLLVIITEIIVSGALVGLMVAVKPVETLAAMAVFGLGTWIAFMILRKRIGELAEVSHTTHTEILKWSNQCAGGAREAIVLGRQSFFVDQFRTHSTRFSHARADYAVFKDLPRMVLEALAVATMMAMVVVLVLRDQTSGEIVPFLAMAAVAAFRIMPSATRVYSAAMTLRFTRPQIEAVKADFDAAQAVGIDIWPERDEPQAARQPAEERIAFTESVVLDGIGYRYGGAARPALDNVSLTIPRGASIGIVGPSGGGKTTLIGILMGLLEPQQGEMRVDGVSVSGHLPAWRRRIGYIPQDIYLLDDTIRANVAFGVPPEDVDEDAVRRAVVAAQLETFLADQPQGLDTMVGERGVKLSGGQRQRIAIARALYHDPEVLLLDEATAALDNRTEQEVSLAIDALSHSKTLVIIAHRLSTVRSCDTLYYLSEGRIAASGNFEELLKFDDFRRMAVVE